MVGLASAETGELKGDVIFIARKPFAALGLRATEGLTGKQIRN